LTFYVATYDELNHGFAQEVARIGALYGADGYIQIGRGVHTVSRTDIECFKFQTVELVAQSFPAHDLVGVETAAMWSLTDFKHSQDVIYVFGPRIGTLDSVLDQMHETVTIEGPVLPTDVCAGIVLHDRLVKQ
jgi:hypothetical protein